jgi:anthranilate synthase component 1
MPKPDLDGFLARAKNANLIPVWQDVLADLETPVSTFLTFQNSAPAFLLESVEGGATTGRYSFLGFDPALIFSSKGEIVTVQRGRETQESAGDPLTALAAIMKAFRPATDEGMPPFIGGAVGYLGYDLVRHFEKLPDANPDDLNLPDSMMMVPSMLLVFDHVGKTVRVIVPAETGDDPAAAYRRAARRVEQVVRVLQTHTVKRPVEPAASTTAVRSNFSRADFEAAVARCREYILDGDILQAVLSQRFDALFDGQPFDLYRKLRAVNPSPYMFFLDFGDFQLVGSSPEPHVKVRGERVTVKPIAGTRPRGKTAAEDRALAAELLADEKESAEHVMLVDLGRNDLGRICRTGSVEVTEFRQVEPYSHVMHMVSEVEGRLGEGQDAFAAIRATFPAGTVSGAPKIRAMEIIDELEPTRRGPYAGLAGYFSYDGNMDTCITIRTALVTGGHAYVQAGAGIVADSQPAAEYEETRRKARAVLLALGLEGDER